MQERNKKAPIKMEKERKVKPKRKKDNENLRKIGNSEKR